MKLLSPIVGRTGTTDGPNNSKYASPEPAVNDAAVWTEKRWWSSRRGSGRDDRTKMELRGALYAHYSLLFVDIAWRRQPSSDADERDHGRHPLGGANLDGDRPALAEEDVNCKLELEGLNSMDDKMYQHDVNILVEALGEAADHKKRLLEALERRH